MPRQFTRRRFLSSAGAAASVAVAGSALFNVESLFAATTYVRRNVGGMSAYDPVITDYRKAIKAMQALPTTNPLSWTYQAAIHGTTLSNNLTAWNTCEHGSYWFWPWHRMYLHYFERIIRKMCGNPCWALPYWDWSSPSQRQLPSMFRDTSSELYTSNRNTAMNNGTGSLPGGDVDYSSAFAFTDFTSGSASLEGTPHGAVHVDIGGWMGFVPTAAQDPIFYLHHCNIDRLWDLWLAQGGRSDPLNDTTWKTQKFTFFDEAGTQVQMDSCQVLRAAAQLNYVYEGEPAQVNQNCLRIIRVPIWAIYEVLFKIPIPPVELGPEPVSFPIDIAQLKDRVTGILANKSQKLLLQLEDVEAAEQPGVVWEVYVGLPVGQEPTTENLHFVGNIALFGSGIRSEVHGHHKFMPAKFSFVINRALEESMRSNAEKLDVTFVPHGVLIDGKPSRPEVKSKVRIGSASLVVATEKEGEKPR